MVNNIKDHTKDENSKRISSKKTALGVELGKALIPSYKVSYLCSISPTFLVMLAELSEIFRYQTRTKSSVIMGWIMGTWPLLG